MKEFFSALQSTKGGELFFNIVVILAGIVLIFLAIREIVTWYYKINRIVELLESIDEKLDRSLKVETRDNPSGNSEKAINADINTEASFGTRVRELLTKEYHIKDLFSDINDKN